MSVLNTLKNLDEYFKEIIKKADAVKDDFRELLSSSSIAIMFSFNWFLVATYAKFATDTIQVEGV